jgi:hypothetical protein
VTKCHDSASGTPAPAREPSADEASPERLGVDEVRERLLAVDLDHRQALAVAGLELRVAGDVDELQLEPELSLDVPYDVERALAEVAVGGAVERDPGQG